MFKDLLTRQIYQIQQINFCLLERRRRKSPRTVTVSSWDSCRSLRLCFCTEVFWTLSWHAMFINDLSSWGWTPSSYQRWNSGSCRTLGFCISSLILDFQKCSQNKLSIWIQSILMCLYLHGKQDNFFLNIGEKQSPWASSRDSVIYP